MSSRIRLALRMERIAPFHVMRILARAQAMEAQGRSIIHMEVGEPRFPTPPPIVEAARRALDAGETFYTPALGAPRLREAIATYYQERFGLPVDSERIVVTPGSSAGLQLLLAMLCGPGDQVLLTDPGYPCNRHFVELFDATPVMLPVRAENGYLPTLDELDIHWTPETRVLLLASPANPTGAVISPDRLREYAAWAAKRGCVLIVDEIYQGLQHCGTPHTALAAGNDVIVVNSFSKYFCMTGWRLGWLVLPEPLLEPAERLAQNMYLAAPTLAQQAALAAFDRATLAILDERCAALGRKLDFMREVLCSIGMEVPLAPAGAFYLYADLAGLPVSASQFSQRLLDEKSVAVTPGVDFGDYRAERHVRLACVADDSELRRAADALCEFVSPMRDG